MGIEETFEYYRVAQREIKAIEDEITTVKRRLRELEDDNPAAESKLIRNWKVC
jgi:hypothetical protein